jgi:mannosyltransferase OCH1-like enzyme
MILFVYGGMYADMDAKCYQNLYHYMDESELMLIRSPNSPFRGITNFFMGSSARHPFLLAVLHAMTKSYYSVYHLAISSVGPLLSTGPALVALTFNRFIRQNPEYDMSTLLLPASIVRNDKKIKRLPQHIIAHFGHSAWVTNHGIIMDSMRIVILTAVILIMIYLIWCKPNKTICC